MEFSFQLLRRRIIEFGLVVVRESHGFRSAADPKPSRSRSFSAGVMDFVVSRDYDDPERVSVIFGIPESTTLIKILISF